MIFSFDLVVILLVVKYIRRIEKCMEKKKSIFLPPTAGTYVAFHVDIFFSIWGRMQNVLF